MTPPAPGPERARTRQAIPGDREPMGITTRLEEDCNPPCLGRAPAVLRHARRILADLRGRPATHGRNALVDSLRTTGGPVTGGPEATFLRHAFFPSTWRMALEMGLADGQVLRLVRSMPAPHDGDTEIVRDRRMDDALATVDGFLQILSDASLPNRAARAERAERCLAIASGTATIRAFADRSGQAVNLTSSTP